MRQLFTKKNVSPKIKTMAKEENIDEVEKKSKMIQITGRVSQSVKDEFYELQESGGYETFCLFMEALLERYKNPLKINKDNVAKIAELQEKLKSKDDKIEELEIFKDNSIHGLEKQTQDIEELRAEYNQAMARIEQLQHEKSDLETMAKEYNTLKTEVSGCISVPVSELDMKCLQFMAERECRIRKRNDITPAKFFGYAVQEMLIKGNKFAIDSIPDAVIAKFKQEIANGQ